MEAFLSYDRLISFHRMRLDVKEFPKDKLNMAYLDNKFSQFMIHLNNLNDTEMIQKVLSEIYLQLQDGDEVYKYSLEHPELFEKIFYFLDTNECRLDLYSQEYTKIRILASKCFKQFCFILKSKEYLDECEFIKNVHIVFDDRNEKVRCYVYTGLIYYAQSRYGIDTLLRNNILIQIIDKLIFEGRSTKVLKTILQLINEILNSEGAPQIALKRNLIRNLNLYLNDEDKEIRLDVILNFGSLSFCEEGKSAIAEEGSLIINVLKELRMF
jgi:hypothetical protein